MIYNSNIAEYEKKEEVMTTNEMNHFVGIMIILPLALGAVMLLTGVLYLLWPSKKKQNSHLVMGAQQNFFPQERAHTEPLNVVKPTVNRILSNEERLKDVHSPSGCAEY